MKDIRLGYELETGNEIKIAVKKDDGYRTIMVRVFDDHREDSYREFRIHPRHVDTVQEIMSSLEFLEAEN